MQGLLLLNKPEGITSFGAVATVRRAANEKRVGHTGTLDPLATGVLPILLGRATALSSLMLDADKRYEATVRLGITTDTDDITGEVLSKNEVLVSNEDIKNVLLLFVGKISQTPPMYSAIKKDGVRLYKLAREGKTVDIPSREITVFELSKTSDISSENEFTLKCHVSKGTYIRSLIRNIGEKLGCGATMTKLTRTDACGFNIADTVSPEILTSDNIGEYLMSEEKAVEYLPVISVSDSQAVRFCNGGQLSFDRLGGISPSDGSLYRIKNGDLFLGVGFADCKNSQIGIKCVINYPKGDTR